MSVSSVHFYNTLSVCRIVCSQSKVKSPSVTICSTLSTLCYIAPLPFTLVPTILLSVSMSFCLSCLFICWFWFYIPHVSEITWLLIFSTCLILLSIMFSRSIHVVLQMAAFHLSLWLSSIPLYMYRTFFIQSSIKGHFGCLRVVATVNAAVNRGVHVSLQIDVSKFGGSILNL